MIKAFLFDNGGVITTGGRGTEVPTRLALKLNITPDEALQLLKPIWQDYSRGKLSETEFWDLVTASYGKPIAKEKRSIWNKWNDMTPIPEMLQLVERLKTNGYPVGMLSNIVPNTEKEIRASGGYDSFDFLVLSCKTGYCKPDPEIYGIALKHLGNIKPSEIVFLDDHERYLAPARKMGMQTILVKSPSQTIKDVEVLLSS